MTKERAVSHLETNLAGNQDRSLATAADTQPPTPAASPKAVTDGGNADSASGAETMALARAMEQLIAVMSALPGQIDRGIERGLERHSERLIQAINALPERIDQGIKNGFEQHAGRVRAEHDRPPEDQAGVLIPQGGESRDSPPVTEPPESETGARRRRRHRQARQKLPPEALFDRWEWEQECLEFEAEIEREKLSQTRSKPTLRRIGANIRTPELRTVGGFASDWSRRKGRYNG